MEKYKEMLATLAKTSAEIESTKRSYKELENSIMGENPLERFKNRKALTNDLNDVKPVLIKLKIGGIEK